MRLPVPAIAPLVSAPTRKVQFVVELVGPRTVPTAQAAELLRPDWRASLGQPELWAMRPADTTWQPLRALMHGSYDSIALAWDMVTPQGDLSPASATHLAGVAERFANRMGRRAIPLTAPNDLPTEVRRLKGAVQSLDAGLTVLIVSPQPVAVSEFGREMEAMGLVPANDEWGWFGQGHPEPLFAATPFEAPMTDGITLGFRLARCPDPSVALEGLLNVVDALSRSGLAAFDEDRLPLTAAKRETLRQEIRAGTEALTSIGFAPGSWPALKAFV
ncbi:hypothetical protein EON82_08680 [bacterium]|nr:MAG: hypothetical protein EON82_08680 [bacterium]